MKSLLTLVKISPLFFKEQPVVEGTIFRCGPYQWEVTEIGNEHIAYTNITDGSAYKTARPFFEKEFLTQEKRIAISSDYTAT